MMLRLICCIFLLHSCQSQDESEKDVPCIYTLEGVRGVMESPGFPQPYPSLQNCIYDLVRPNEEYCGIKLFVDEFDVETVRGEAFCQKDYFTVEYCVPDRGMRMCGNQTGFQYQYLFQSGATAIRFIFHSDGSNSSKGFRIRYRMLRQCTGPFTDPPISEIPRSRGTECYTRITDREGTINTPYHPNNYPNNVDCVYEFVREDPKICGVNMRSVTFDLQRPMRTPFGGACLDVFHMPSCQYLCGKDIDFTWIARYQPGATSLKFHFHADEERTYNGFFISFRYVYTC